MRGTKIGFVAEKSKKALASIRWKKVPEVQPGPQTASPANLPVLEGGEDVILPRPFRLVSGQR